MAPSRPTALAGGRQRSAVLLLCALSACAFGPRSAFALWPVGSPLSADRRPVDPLPATSSADVVQELPPVQAPAPSPPAQEKPSGPKNPPVAPEEGQKTGEEKEKPPEPETKRARQPWYSVHEQGTIVTQKHDDFPSPYIGPLSLLPEEGAATTETATLYWDNKLWYGADLVFNPEISGGRGFSGTSGIAGFPNGEATRVGAVEPTPYIARLFVRQVWGLGGEEEKVEDAANQIAGVRDVNRVTLIAGKLSATDVFDNNRYSHDPRTQFLDWALMYNGAWDYPANVRGYTYGVAAEYTTLFYAVRYGIFAEPAEANGAALDPHFLKANGQILEVEERYDMDNPGKIREWVFLNRAHMGDYREAIEAMPVDPNVTLTRSYRYKYGFGANWEQPITRDWGVWARIGWNDGHTESWAFTAIDRTIVLGTQLAGRYWRRPDDTVGLAFVVNGLAPDHRDYLRAGGLDFIIGDGRLNYAPEQILETYYCWQLVKGIFVTLDFQGVNHPAFNADRGPVAIGTIRVHFEH